MTDSIMDALEAAEVPSEMLFSEKFASPVSFDLSLIESREAQIEYFGNQYQYNGKETLLEFFEKNALPAKFACRVGVCGACKIKCSSTDVDQFTDTGLTRSDKKNGYILSCVSRPLPNGSLKIV